MLVVCGQGKKAIPIDSILGRLSMSLGCGKGRRPSIPLESILGRLSMLVVCGKERRPSIPTESILSRLSCCWFVSIIPVDMFGFILPCSVYWYTLCVVSLCCLCEQLHVCWCTLNLTVRRKA